MGNRSKAAGARLPEPSRRLIMAATSVAALGAVMPIASVATSAQAAVDEGTRRCKHWVAIDKQIGHLQTRWARLESWLSRQYDDWFKLTKAEQLALPRAKELDDIDNILDVLFEKREALLETIPTSGSTTVKAVTARLAVVECLIWADDHPEAHALIAGARKDLLAIAQA